MTEFPTYITSVAIYINERKDLYGDVELYTCYGDTQQHKVRLGKSIDSIGYIFRVLKVFNKYTEEVV